MKNTKKKEFTIIISLIVLFASLLVISIIQQISSGEIDETYTNGIFFIFCIVAIVVLFFFVLNSKKYFFPEEKDRKKNEQEVNVKEFMNYIKRNTKIEIIDKNLKDELCKDDFEEQEDVEVSVEFKEITDDKPIVITGEKEKKEERFEPLEEKVEDVIPVGEDESRFYMLTQIDKRFENYKGPKYDNKITLRKLCDDFRNYSAGRLKLYYDIEDIRRFIAGLSVTKLIILQGMSGTGKTSLAYAFGEFLDNKTVVVPIQPMWKERTDLVGYYNEFTKKFNETTLLYKMYEANYNKEIYITVLDEMNIARIEYYFAEFLSLLELPNPEGRNLDVVSDKWDNDPILLKDGKLRLPINMWFIGTANNDDSTFAISDKVYDRAMVLNLDKKAKKFDAPLFTPTKVSSEHLQKLFVEAQEEYAISDRNSRRIKKLDEYMIEKFHLTFGNRIMKQINSYVPVLVSCGGTELQAIDDILSRKVFRKLESKNPVYVRQQAEGLCSFLDELFGEDQMPLCKEAIRLIEQNV